MPSQLSPLWSPHEDDCLRRAYPDYGLAMKLLPHRSLQGIKHRAGKIGITHPRRSWPSGRLKRAAELYRAGAPWPEIQALFPDVPRGNIASRLARQARRPRAALRTIGEPALDAIRQRAAKHGWNFGELDRQTGCKRYYSRNRRHIRLASVLAAATLLGGEVSIVWGDEHA